MTDTAKALSADMAANCCNGRVGRRLLDLAAQDEKMAHLVMPTGVELIKAASSAGVAAKETVNCCNGRVGRQLNAQELLNSFTAE